MCIFTDKGNFSHGLPTIILCDTILKLSKFLTLIPNLVITTLFAINSWSVPVSWFLFLFLFSLCNHPQERLNSTQFYMHKNV